MPPAVSTVGDILKRNGLVNKRRRRGGAYSVDRGDRTAAIRNNHVWGVDYKGWFTLGNGDRCDPLTMSDLHNRYIAVCEGSATGNAVLDKARISLCIQAIRAS